MMRDKKMILKLEAFKPTNISSDAWLKHIDEIAPALGYLIISFNELDSEISESILLLSELKSDQQISAVYPLILSKSFAERTRDLARILKMSASKDSRNTELLREINEIVNRIETLGKVRNSYVHAGWHDMEIDDNVHYVNSKLKYEKQKLYHEYLDCSLETIQGYEDDIVKIIDDLGDLLKKIGVKE